MIEIRNVTKHFDNIIAVDHVSVTIKEGNVFGLIGTNGAGKSTVLRLTTGIYRPDEGEILIDTLPVYDNREAKKRFFFIPDEPFFSTMRMRWRWSGTMSAFMNLSTAGSFMMRWRSLGWIKNGRSIRFPRG